MNLKQTNSVQLSMNEDLIEHCIEVIKLTGYKYFREHARYARDVVGTIDNSKIYISWKDGFSLKGKGRL